MATGGLPQSQLSLGSCGVEEKRSTRGPLGLDTTQWRDALETVINSRKLSDALGNPSTQRITLYITDKYNTTHF